MEFTYENQGTSTYLVYKIAEDDSLDTLSLGMLTNNKITGLVPAMFTQMDGERFIKYNVSSKVSVKQFFTGAVNKKRLTGVFAGIVNAMLSAEEYMINPDNILLDLDYIYTDVSTCETNLICLPIMNEQAQAADLGVMFKSIVFSTQFDQTENCDYVAKIINYLNSSPIFSLENFKAVLDEIMADAVPVQKTVQDAAQQSKTTVQPQVAQVSAQQSMPQSISQQPIVQPSKPQVSLQASVQQPVQQPTAPSMVQPTVKNPSKGKVQQPQTAQSAANSQEKQISMMTLLTHYNKENKELYKKQKDQKKNQKKTEKENGKKKETKQENAGFAIPGQESPANGTTVLQTEKAQIPTAVVQQPLVQENVFQQGKANFGETTVLNAGSHIGETTVLNAASLQKEIQPYLLRIKNNTKIVIDKPVFRIGKERSYVDYFISDNSAISRSHANILVRGEEYFVVDTNSTNHTYVNGIMIQSNVETKISHETKLQFADEEFEFRLY